MKIELRVLCAYGVIAISVEPGFRRSNYDAMSAGQTFHSEDNASIPLSPG
jgi:hypothetical protein